MILDSLMALASPRNGKSKRVSSWDRTGKNRDFIEIPARERVTIADIDGPGCIRHLWFTLACKDPDWTRKVVLRMYWDDEDSPSVLAPLADFFGGGHGKISRLISEPIVVIPAPGTHSGAMNTYFAMPFLSRARIEVSNDGEEPVRAFYFHVDYEEMPASEIPPFRFHAQWRRVNPTQPPDPISPVNLSDQHNYLILEATGRGNYVGCSLSFDSSNQSLSKETFFAPWEGDDMIVVDGEPFPPAIHGTGLEDYFGYAWGFREEFCAPYIGVSYKEVSPFSENWRLGKWSVYRFHIRDPIPFNTSIRVSVEHGHANARSDDYSSTAYWYQEEPHAPFDILPVALRLPGTKTHA